MTPTMPRRPARRPSRALAQRLAQAYFRNGYVRTPSERRVAKEGWRRYKKGEEVRLIAGSKDELRQIRSLLEGGGFKPGRPFRKGTKFCQPIYGRDAVARFLQLVDEGSDA